MSEKTLFDKVWERHTVCTLPTGETQLFVALHLIHEVTSAPAFGMLAEKRLHVAYPERTFATPDHIAPTRRDERLRPLQDPLAEDLMTALQQSCTRYGIKFFGMGSAQHGIVHVIGPELGLTQPGMTVACGDSHTSTHGAFGAIAFGIGTTQVRDVLATQTVALKKPRVRQIRVHGRLLPGVTAKDLALAMIAKLGVSGGEGYAYEYAGEAISHLSMEGRMTLCNMSIEGGARFGYVNPDAVTYQYLFGRPYVPQNKAFDKRVAGWKAIKSGSDAVFDDIVNLTGSDVEPMVTWGTNPGQAIPVNGCIPSDADQEALAYMGLHAGQKMVGTPINVAFIGSCTNGRAEDLESAVKLIKDQRRRVASGVRALVVPGSRAVHTYAVERGWDHVFTDAGFEFRDAGCSMCLAMNPDKLRGRELCASSSNRNFKGRQGSAEGRTVLMSPAMVAAAALNGHITDIRNLQR